MIGLAFLASASALFPQSNPAKIGMFEGSGDVGTVLHPGSVKMDEASKTYIVTGSGQNIWAAEDDFQFVWKKVSASDVTLGAEIRMTGVGGDRHRKGVLMIRQSLEPDSAYADVAVHGDGLTSLQFRGKKGGATQEIEASVSGPQRVEIEKAGDHFSMWIGNDERSLQFSGALTFVTLTAPFYVGIGVSAHDKDDVQTMKFSNVLFRSAEADRRGATKTFSTITTINVRSGDARVTYVTPEHIDSAEWTKDGKSIMYQADGKSNVVAASLYGVPAPSNLPVGANAPEPAVSPDGTQRANLMCVITGAVRKAGDPDQEDCMNLSVTLLSDNTTRWLERMQGGSISRRPWSPDGRRLVYVSYQSVIQP